MNDAGRSQAEGKRACLRFLMAANGFVDRNDLDGLRREVGHAVECAPCARWVFVLIRWGRDFTDAKNDAALVATQPQRRLVGRRRATVRAVGPDDRSPRRRS